MDTTSRTYGSAGYGMVAIDVLAGPLVCFTI